MPRFALLGFCLVVGLAFSILSFHQKEELQLETLQGETFHLSDFSGRWVVINVWASWCSACKEEIPEFNYLHQYYKDKMQVFSLNGDASVPEDTVREERGELKIQYPGLKRRVLQQFKLADTENVPATILISPEGEVSEPLYGVQTAADILEKT